MLFMSRASRSKVATVSFAALVYGTTGANTSLSQYREALMHRMTMALTKTGERSPLCSGSTPGSPVPFPAEEDQP